MCRAFSLTIYLHSLFFDFSILDIIVHIITSLNTGVGSGLRLDFLANEVSEPEGQTRLKLGRNSAGLIERLKLTHHKGRPYCLK